MEIKLIKLKHKLTPLRRSVTTAEQYGQEILAWAKRNFPTQDTLGLGPLEEIGEWGRFILKCSQGIRMGASQSEGERARIMEEGCFDSVADAMVFTLQLAAIHEVKLQWTQMDSYIMLNKKENKWWAVGAYLVNLSQWFIRVVAIKSAFQKPGLEEKRIWLQGLLNNLGLLSYLSGHDPVCDCLTPVWDQVKTRDWKKYPTDGRTK